MPTKRNSFVSNCIAVYWLVLLLLWQSIAPALAMPATDTSIATNRLSVSAVYQLPGDTVVVRHAPNLNGGRVEGSVRQLLGEGVNINSGMVITGDLLVPGSPNVQRNGTGIYNGTIQGTGSTSPSGYQVNINSNTTLRHVITRTNPITMDTVPAPPNPVGNRNISLNPGQNPGDFATLRNLTLNSNHGELVVPPGTYGDFIANNGSSFVFGVENEATTYNLQRLTLNGNANLQVRGVVTINVKQDVNINGPATTGLAASPSSLSLNISSGGLNLNSSNNSFYGVVKAPAGTISINSGCLIQGLVVCDRLNLNSNGTLKGLDIDAVGPTITIDQPAEDAVVTTSTVTVTGTYNDDSAATVKVNNVAATLNGNSYSATVPLTIGSNTLTVVATDVFGNVSQLTRAITRADANNQPPVVNPGPNQTITLLDSVTLNGTATDDGQPAGSTLSVNWSKISGPGTVTFANPASAGTTASFSAAGTYVLRLTASDGQLTVNSNVTIEVNPAPINAAPVVNAGPDQPVTLPNSATLAGSVTDDNLPQGNSLTIVWEKLSGPGTVTFADAASPTTTVSFSTAGTYILKLSAADGELTSSDNVTITVEPEPPTNQPPVVNAGSDQSLSMEGNLLLNGGNESALVDGEIPGWTEVAGNGWTQAGAGINGFPTAMEGNSYFYAGETAAAEMRQDVDVSAFADAIDAGTQQFAFRGFLRSGDEPTPDSAQVIVEYRDADNSQVLASYDSSTTTSIGEWLKVADLRVAPADTRWVRVRLISIRNSSSSNDVFFDHLSLRSVGKAQTSLNGVVTDDGLPGNNLTHSWTKVSGPGNVSFSNPAQVATKVSFDAPGSYLLRLTADDTALTGSDTITITIANNNQAPVVNAGADQSLTLPNTAELSGMVTDDGLPASGSLTITWQKISGPGEVTFTNANAAVTTARFSAAGVYVLRLTATDSALSDSDEITITVNEPQQNLAPVVDAGLDKSITLPDNVSLQGLVTDDGLPNSTLNITWSKVTGPGTVTFADANAATTTALFSEAGSYTLRLTATDGELTGSDEIVIMVAAEAVNQAPIVNAGEDQTVVLPALITVAGVVTDDNLPTGSSLTYSWSKVSGSGEVTFENANALSTTVTFDEAGTYVLRLTASDSLLSNSDEVTITLQQRPMVMVYSSPEGFQSEQLTLKAGETLLLIRNRSGLDNLTYQVIQGGQTFTIPAALGATVGLRITLAAGQAVLTEANNPGWQCQITVEP